MKNKYIPLILTLVAIAISTFLWDKINLSYDIQNQIYGEYSVEQYNPNNETLRFLLFVSLPLFTFLTTYLIFNSQNTYSFNQVIFSNSDHIKNKNNFYYNIFIIFFIIILILEFLTLDFFKLSKNIDFVHDGMLLTPSNNAYLLNKFWSSSYVSRGLFANFGPVVLWKFFGFKSVGLMHMTNLILLFSNKILLIFICKEISKNIIFSEDKKLLYFLILSILSISLVSYFQLNAIPERLFLFLLFFLIFIYSNNQINKFSFALFLMGLFSNISMLWYIDIGAYINVLILFLLIYFLIRSEIKKFTSIFFGIIFSWLMFIFLTPAIEVKEFFHAVLSIYMTVDYWNGLIYPTPFLSGDARSTKALLLLILTGVLTIIVNFNKNVRLTTNNKTLFLFIFIASLLIFKTALSRSDTPHIKVSGGFSFILIYSIGLYFLFHLFERKEKLNIYISKFAKALKKNYVNLLIVFILLNCIVLKTNITDLKNIFSSKNNISKFVNLNDDEYLSLDYRELMKYYEDLTNNEKCVQIFTNEAAIPYFLNKPTCTQFYMMYSLAPLEIQKKFIKQLKRLKPQIILYNSEITTWGFSSKHAPLAFEYIGQNYSFHSKFKFWTFYKIK